MGSGDVGLGLRPGVRRLTLHGYIYIYIYVCVCVGECDVYVVTLRCLGA